MSEKYDFDLISFGMRLKKIRMFYDKTQEGVAEALGVSVKTVQNWENGKKAPNVDNLFALADLYDMRAGEILQDEDYRLFNKRYKSRKRTIETFEIPGRIETYAEITEDNYYNRYEIWIFDDFARQKLMHASMDRIVTYDKVRDYILENADMIVEEYREWLLSTLTDSEIDFQIRQTIMDKMRFENDHVTAPGCMYNNGGVVLGESNLDEDDGGMLDEEQF